MRKLLLSFSLTLIAATSFGQSIWEINFENTTTLNRVLIDTVTNPSNIWQIGHPNKTVFTNPNSPPNVIATDTLNVYSTNDTSSFTIIHIAGDGWQGYPKIDIGGWYFVNSDTITDFGYIEFSSDHGNTWFLVDSYTSFCTWGATMEIPVFSGNSFGWKHFYYCIDPQTTVNHGDTILYRFTFISDSIQTNKDGLMFDDLHFEDWSEGIGEVQNDNLILLFPNPTNSLLYIDIQKQSVKKTVQIFSYNGQLLFEDNNFNSMYVDIAKLNLTEGLYFLKYSDTKSYAIKKFIIQH